MPTFLLKRFNKMRIAYALFIENQRKDLIPGIQTFLANPMTTLHQQSSLRAAVVSIRV